MRTLVIHISVPKSYVDEIRTMMPDGWKVVQTFKGDKNVELLRQAEILVGWSSESARACLEEGAKLRWVHSWAAGVESMPLDEFAKRGIILTNSSGVHGQPISETIFALMLALTRGVHVNVRNQVQRLWKANASMREMHGKTVGILGTGVIGSETAKIAGAFDMTVIGMRRSGGSLPGFDEIVDASGLEYLVSRSDYIVNTLPLTKETKHLIDGSVFAMMKRGAFYINIGRGGTTDTDALIEALRNGQLAGAGLDVFEEEPLPGPSPLWDMENVIIVPHESGMTEHYDRRATDILVAGLKDYLEGREPSVSLVDLQLGY